MGDYDADFYAGLTENSLRSARIVVPLVAALCQPRSVVDVGCGSGAWLKAWREAGVTDVLGLDGAWVPRQSLVIAPELFRAIDLARPMTLERRFDMAMSVEVGEHLPPARAEGFVADLVALSPVVLFSAAIPFQGGTAHVNERWPSYWAAHFARHGYLAIDALRPRLWRADGVEWWYAQNILLFASRAALAGNPALAAARAATSDDFLDLVHPRRYEALADPAKQKWKSLLRQSVAAFGRRGRK